MSDGVLGSQRPAGATWLSELDKAESKAVPGVLQSAIGGYTARRQRYGNSTINPGRGALVASVSMSWSTVLC